MVNKIKLYTPVGVIIVTKTPQGALVSTKTNAKNTAVNLEVYKREIEQARTILGS